MNSQLTNRSVKSKKWRNNGGRIESMKGEIESWVTIVKDDEESWEALALAQSLRKALTSRKLSILVEKNVSNKMRYILGHFFDLVQPTVSKNAKEVFAQLWYLTTWTKCVFLKSGCLGLENVDELFNHKDFSIVLNKNYENNSQKQFAFDLVVFKPSFETAEVLMKNATQKDEKTRIFEYFNDCWNNSEERQIDSSYLLWPRGKSHGSAKILWKSFSNLPAEESKENYSIKFFEVLRNYVLPSIQNLEASWVEDFVKTSFPKQAFEFPANINLQCKANTKPTSGAPLDENETLRNSIAIIGMSSRFPGANTLEEYWQLLVEGRYTVRRFPEGRETFDIPGIEESVAGFLSCPIDEFDAEFFDVNPKDAWVIDPQQRILLEVAWEAIEDARVNASTLKNTKTGVFVGNLLQDYERVFPDSQELGISENDRVLGNFLGATSGRISHCLGLRGPSLSHEAGCSSGLGALHLACESLLRSECDIAISGGVNLIILPRAYNTAVLSHDFKCKTFDESADGFVSGEACGAFLLKRYEAAVKDGDRIRAVIRGTGMSNDGASLCYGTPNPEAHARTHRLAMKNAGVSPNEVDYVETHGTGTQKGDIGEIYGLCEAYGRNRKSPLLIGSVKPNIGHGEAAAAVGSVVKLVLALENEAIPQNIFLEKINPKMALDSIPGIIPTKLTPWKGTRRLAGVSSFSLTGSLVHAIFQSTPPTDNFNQSQESVTPFYLITISAKSSKALEAQKQNYLEYFKANGSFNLADVAYATNVTRTHFPHRIAVLAASMEELNKKLELGNFFSGKDIPVILKDEEVIDLVKMSPNLGEGDVSKERWHEFYETIGRLYVEGANFNWDEWFGKREKKIGLPLYPFQREKCWFQMENFPTVMKNRIDRDSIMKSVHPLLGWRIPSPDSLIFQNQIEILPIFSLYRSVGEIIEILLGASFQVENYRSSFSLEDIQILSECEKGAIIQTTIKKVLDGKDSHKISMQKQISRNEWKCFLSAKLVSCEDERVTPSEDPISQIEVPNVKGYISHPIVLEKFLEKAFLPSDENKKSSFSFPLKIKKLSLWIRESFPSQTNRLFSCSDEKGGHGTLLESQQCFIQVFL